MAKFKQAITILAVICVIFSLFLQESVFADENETEVQEPIDIDEEPSDEEEHDLIADENNIQPDDMIEEEIAVLSDTMFNGSGTQEEPFKIGSQTDLMNLSNAVAAGYSTAGKYYLLNGDIYISGELYPIGTEENPFQGIFYAYDSSPRNIYDLKMNGYNDYTALFAYIQEARIENINLVDVNIRGKDYTASLAGYARESHIKNCTISGEISGNFAVSGLVSVLFDSTIEGTASFASITAETMAGGIVSSIMGYDSKVLDSFFSGSIKLVSSADDSAAGGIAAYLQNGLIEGCFSMADIQSAPGVQQVGGFISRTDGGTIKSSYGAGTINSDYAAGFVYRSSGGKIENCYSSIRISGNDFYSGFVSIGQDQTSFQSCYYNKEINEGYVSENSAEGITGLATYEMTAEASEKMIGLESDLWHFDENSGNSRFYPQLSAFYGGKYNAYSMKSAEAGTFYSVKFIIPFDMTTEDFHLVYQLVLPGDGCASPVLIGEDAELHIGWSLAEGGSAIYGTDKIPNINENLVLYPVFSQRLTFKVIYTAEGAETGSVPEDNKPYSAGDTAIIKENQGNLKKSGYEFDGWKDQNGRSHIPGDNVIITKSLKLDPVWKEVKTSSGGGGSSSSVSNYYGGYDLSDYTNSFLKFAEIFKTMGELYTQEPDNKISIDSEIYFKESQGIFEDYVEMLLKFSIEFPLEVLK